MSHPTVMIVCDYSLNYLGGAQIALMRQAEVLAASGWQVVVVAPDAAETVRALGLAGVKGFSPTLRGTLPRVSLPVTQRLPVLVERVRALIREHEVTAVVLHSEFALSAASITAARAEGVPALHTVHTFFWRAPTVLSPLAPIVAGLHRAMTAIRTPHRVQGSTPINNALRSMTLKVAHEADVVLSPSIHQAKALRQAGLRDVRVVSNAMQPVSVPTAEPQEGVLRLVWAGRFAPEKRLIVALDAVAWANERVGRIAVHLDVAGGYGLDRPGVRFHGRLSTSQVGELVTRADAALLTSVGFDNQPMIALEAFERATPIVLVDPVLGAEFGPAAVTADRDDAEALADTLLEIVHAPAILKRAGVAAHAYAADRGAEAHARDMRQIIESLHRSPTIPTGSSYT